MKGNILNKIDFYSSNYNFIYNGVNKITSPVGGIFSILTIIILSIYIFIQIIEHINNGNRRLKYQVQISSTTDEISLSSSIGFHFGNIFGESLTDYENYFTLKASFITRTRGTDNKLLTNQNTVSLRKCHSNDFLDYKYLSESSLNLNLNQSVCFDKIDNFKLSASLKENINSYVKLSIEPCINNTVNNNSCYSSDKIQTLISKNRLFLSIYYLDNLITDKDDLLIKDLRKDYVNIDRAQFQILEYHISPSYLFYTDSVIYSEENSSKYNSVDKLNHHSFNINSNTTTLLNIYFFPSNKKVVYYLISSSFMHYLAQIGGLLKIIMIFFEFFISPFNRRKADETILKILYNVKRTQLNKTLLTSMCSEKIDSKAEKIGNGTEPKIKLRLKLNINDNKIHQVSTEEQNIQPIIKTDNINFNTSNNILLINNNDLKINKKPFEFTMDDIHLTKLEEKEVTNVIKYIFQRNNTSTDLGQMNNTLFTTCENIKILFCYCFIFKQLRKRNDVYRRLMTNTIKYLDSINVIKTVCEFEKLKFVFFDEKQLSLFNLLSKPRNPLEVLENEIRFSTLNNETPFTYEKANAFLVELKNRKNLSRVDKKLLELVNK